MSNESVLHSKLPEAQRYQVRRDGAADLAFTGLMLGDGETSVLVLDKFKNEWVCRGHTCRIYRSAPPSNRFVVEFVAWSQVTNERDRCEAFSCGIGELEYLKAKFLSLTPAGMPEAAKMALDAAGGHDHRLLEVLVEDLDDRGQLASVLGGAEAGAASASEPVERFKQNLRLADEFKTIDEYLEALRVAKNACDRVAGGLMGPDDTPDRRVQAAHNELCRLCDTYDRLRRRLPEDLKTEGERLVHELSILTARTAGFLASREGRLMMGEISMYGAKVADAWSRADAKRAELLA